MCEGTEPECRRTVGTLNYIKVDDCQSEHQIELHYCEVRDHTHKHVYAFFLLCPCPPCHPACLSTWCCPSVRQGKCRSKSIYSLERAAVEQECVCCAAVETEPLSVPILCTNGTRSHHTVLSVTACDCLSKHCS